MQQLEFLRYNDFYVYFHVGYDEKELKDLTVSSFMLHTDEANDADIYHGWNFTEHDWDQSFWFSEKTQLMYGTERFKIGSQTVEYMSMQLQPEKVIKKGQKHDVKIIGLPITYVDSHESRVSYFDFSH